MKQVLLAAVAAAALAATPASATDVGVSISVAQPGVYGRIDIGDFPPPMLIYPEPMIIRPLPRGGVYQPIYLHVPPGHARKWRKHCHRYNACGRPVYFVQDSWYNDVYVPRYREGHYRDSPRWEDRDGDGRRGDRRERRGDGGGGHKHGRHD